jgi:hypothetical protein
MKQENYMTDVSSKKKEKEYTPITKEAYDEMFCYN